MQIKIDNKKNTKGRSKQNVMGIGLTKRANSLMNVNLDVNPLTNIHCIVEKRKAEKT